MDSNKKVDRCLNISSAQFGSNLKPKKDSIDSIPKDKIKNFVAARYIMK